MPFKRASTPCITPVMVRPEKLAALKERMESLGIREQDLEESFVRGAGRGAPEGEQNQQLRLSETCPDGHRRQVPRGPFPGAQPLSGAPGTVRRRGTAADRPVRRKSPRYPAHAQTEGQAQKAFFGAFPAASGRHVSNPRGRTAACIPAPWAISGSPRSAGRNWFLY